MLAAARDAGVNFFDNAEVYAEGQSESDHGRGDRASSAGGAPSYVVSTKFFWGLDRRARTTRTRSTAST